MSRSSKGFADFFPTAPSVLQQKRSRTAQHRKRQKSPSVDDSHHVHAVLDTTVANVRDGDLLVSPNTNGTYVDDTSTPTLQDENDLVQGDLLNSVGSASSSSTTSSVFSSHHRPLGLALGRPPVTLTPLTNNDSSPPEDDKSLADGKYDTFDSQIALPREASREHPEVRSTAPGTSTLTNKSTPESGKLSARPGKGEVKGTITIYDPDLDKTLSSKEKKARQVQYKTFGQEVRPIERDLVAL